MRVAVLIIALVLMMLLGVQACTVSVGGEVLEERATAEGGALGIFMALLFLIGAALAMPLPTGAAVAFVIAAIVGLGGGASTDFSDLTFWGIASLVLAVMSFFGRREKGRKKAEESEEAAFRKAWMGWAAEGATRCTQCPSRRPAAIAPTVVTEGPKPLATSRTLVGQSPSSAREGAWVQERRPRGFYVHLLEPAVLLDHV